MSGKDRFTTLWIKERISKRELPYGWIKGKCGKKLPEPY